MPELDRTKYPASHQIVACQPSDCLDPTSPPHIIKLGMADAIEIYESDLVALIDAGGRYFMVPPPGAPAYAAYLATGLPLILQTRHCDACKRKVLFA